MDAMQNKACFRGQTTCLGLLTKPAPAGAKNLAGLQLRIYLHEWGVGGWCVDEMRNKAEANLAWLQLAAGA